MIAQQAQARDLANLAVKERAVDGIQQSDVCWCGIAQIGLVQIVIPAQADLRTQAAAYHEQAFALQVALAIVQAQVQSPAQAIHQTAGLMQLLCINSLQHPACSP